MGKILKAFINDRLYVDTITEKRSPEHQRIYEKGYKLQEKLEETLNDEERQLLNLLVDTLFDEGCRYAEGKFIRGYQLGVLMTMEVFEGQETFFGERES